MNKKFARRDTPEERELSQKLEELSNLQTLLAQRELDLTTLQAELHAFERRYFRVVGIRYAELDEVEAQIADLLSRSSPQNQEMRMRASEARGRANESAHESKIVQETAGHTEKFKPSDDLKKLYRDVAKSIHPDLVFCPMNILQKFAFVGRVPLLIPQGGTYGNGTSTRTAHPQ